MNPRLMRNSFIYLLIIVAVLAIFFTLFSNPLGGSSEIPISEVVNMAARGDVELTIPPVVITEAREIYGTVIASPPPICVQKE